MSFDFPEEELEEEEEDEEELEEEEVGEEVLEEEEEEELEELEEELEELEELEEEELEEPRGFLCETLGSWAPVAVPFIFAYTTRKRRLVDNLPYINTCLLTNKAQNRKRRFIRIENTKIEKVGLYTKEGLCTYKTRKSKKEVYTQIKHQNRKSGLHM